MELGFDFHWPAYTPPIITLPDGVTKVHTVVMNYCPYVEEDGGVVCPLNSAAVGSTSTSSSSRDLPRDESHSQPVTEKTEMAEGATGLAPGRTDEINETIEDRKVDLDNIPLMKIEATSVYHMLTHSPKNPYCPACQRSKIQRKSNKRRKTPIAERYDAKEFGDVITGDHIFTMSQIDKSIDGKKDAVVLYDLATGYLGCFPTGSKSGEETVQALQNFLGPNQPVGLLYTDAARELYSAAKAIGLCKGQATPGVPASNGLAESKVRKVLEGTRTILDHAGLDPSYWSYACQHFCFAHNHTKRYVKGEEGPEPILGRKLPVEGYKMPELYPFGCLVEILPSPIFTRKYPK